jgi:hypothetical protein
MELTSRLGEYGSAGAGGADCATESEMKASTTNGRQVMDGFLIAVFDLVSIPSEAREPYHNESVCFRKDGIHTPDMKIT